MGNKVYNNGTLGIVLTDEGYATVSGTPVYYYYLKDHQGNNRVVISQGGAVQEVNHYYPFGGLFGDGVQPSIQRYKYNGKELDREFGLDMYDYGARHYDAVLGRWFTVDPLAEKYYFISPYVYVANNPVRYIDPDGREYGDFYDRQGTFLGTDGIDDGKVYILNEDKVARTENTNVNWGGTLAENHVDQLKSNSSEVSMDSELGYMMRAVYAEMRGGDDNAKAIVAESIYNRSQMKSGYEKADGTYSGIIKKFYDISKSGNGSNNVFSNPQDYIYKNDKETNAWRSSVGASIKANSGTSNIGKGVIFYNSASSTFYDKNSKMQKITLDINHRGIKGLWKLK
ncbi:hypothetical protein SDC9_146954 [bioreactor metagenome]|uniref:RHS repeat-associated core domain-containing protein n=1 Tax=bioreactor metagenome TaxID=1076179 RepID=A0A645ED41_9ZZZZ